ncbi:type VI secretion system baseplate subunit TssK [Halioxenophilus aromaticivorans]|uniref:Type VI secretion system baseplate subunit TssK n=2 Tax=Halioxenophilus aromaticivorans TaxID=1306992 RepID=A0AAV3U3N1_9ALTE
MESQYLFPHHFQQQERYIESFIEARAKAIAPFIWGFDSIHLNESALHEGKLGLNLARGVMPDGCPFELPVSAQLPTPLQISAGVKQQLVYLALPIYQAGARHINLQDSPSGLSRYILRQLDVYDYSSDSANQETIETAELQFQLVLESASLGGYTALPVARIQEVTQEGAIILDRNFVPPCLNAANENRLMTYLEDVIGLVQQRAEALAVRFTQDNKDKSASAIVDFMLLQMLNRFEPSLQHLKSLKQLHPERLFELMQTFSGELATFTTKGKRPAAHVRYQHDNLHLCFPSVMAAINKQLSVVLEQTAIPIKVEKRQFGVFVARLSDRSLLTQARFVLAFKSGLQTDKLRNYIPNHLKIGSVETIRDLVNNQLTGITITSLATAPREITYHAGCIYYQLDAQGDLWRSLQKSGGFAFHLAGELPQLEVEFWAIRES